MTTVGFKIVIGMRDVMPLKGFPPGRARVRQRPGRAVEVFIKGADSIRRFLVSERDGAWWPAIENGRNTKVTT